MGLRTPALSGLFYRGASAKRSMTAAVGLSGLALLFYLFRFFLPNSGSDAEALVLRARRDAISDAFQHAWDGYSRYCFGHDTLHPVSHSCEDDFGGWGATAVDSLSTAIILGKEDVVMQILAFIQSLDFETVQGGNKIQVFETTIRHFGGMISAWDLLTGPFMGMAEERTLRQSLHDQMLKLGDILSCSFNTPTGIPRDWVDPAKCQTDAGTMTALTNAGTIILEFARLSAITGNNTYAELAERAEGYLLDPEPATNEPFPGLLGSYVDVGNGRLVNAQGSWGAFSDSFYEYLVKAYIYDSTKYSHYLERWLVAADSTITSIGSHPFGHPEWTLLSDWGGTTLSQRMETLAWFAGGNFILGGMVTNNQTLLEYGLSIADAAGRVYEMTATGLGGEFVTWTTDCAEDDPGCNRNNSLRTTDSRYQLRPEVLETWYHAYRATRDLKYVDWAWSAFEAINKTCRTDSGFSSISDVDAPDGGSKTDKQETFVFAEVLKYLYLIHLDDPNAPFQVQDSRTGRKNTWVFNTEAHPLRVSGTPV